MIVPSTWRAMRSSSAGVRSVTESTVNGGELPCDLQVAAGCVSPSAAKASSRMWSMRPARLRSLATVKSQAR